MSKDKENQRRFLGTYFDTDSVLKISGCANALSWIVLVIYLLAWLAELVQVIFQLYSGLSFGKGSNWMYVNLFLPQLFQPVRGLFYFIGLQAVSKGLLILLDMEENTRRVSQK
ncbi:MAG: hypothetical protein Kow002_21430 [Anaerolineales bacterium]